MKVLLIEDDETIVKLVQERLQQWQIEVIGIDNFHNVMTVFDVEKPHLVMIDIQLPTFDGFHWCRMIREKSTIPIVFLSSRDHPMDMVMAMQLGADDFIQKPFHSEVLVAKIQALLRRSYDYLNTEVSTTAVWCGAEIDYGRGTIHTNHTQIDLTKNELYILKILVESKGKIISRDELMRKLWDDERFVNDNTLTVNVNRLRQRLETIGLVNVIATKKGIGYMAEDA